MSEFDDVLRVASTESRYDGRQVTTYNHVTTLDAGMNPLGALRDLAPGERIQGVRFVGERGYVVTFRQIDPLFALDLSNPAAPRVTDELKIPGFSSYLMPLGEGHLLTIGRSGDENSLDGRMAVRLFGVADPAAIAVLDEYVADATGRYNYSAAEYDPHAFSYFPDAADAAVPGTLSVPLQSYDSGSGAGFSGFLVLRVDPAADPPLRELGRISHAGFDVPGGGCSGGTESMPCHDSVFAADPRRSLFMLDGDGTYLFTLSALGLIASDAAAPGTELGRKALPYEPCCASGGVVSGSTAN